MFSPALLPDVYQPDGGLIDLNVGAFDLRLSIGGKFDSSLECALGWSYGSASNPDLRTAIRVAALALSEPNLRMHADRGLPSPGCWAAALTSGLLDFMRHPVRRRRHAACVSVPQAPTGNSHPVDFLVGVALASTR